MVETGLIIAAGAGTRLAKGKDRTPKPLRKVSGVPLLKRIILTAHKGGLKKIHIVVGFQKEKIIDYVNNETWPVEINFIHNDEWKKSNGISVHAAKGHINENFILMMSDHVFDPQTLDDLRKESLGKHGVILAVDYKIQQIFDKDDATNVLVKNSELVEIDKNLVQYNAVDTGMFLMSPVIFEALDKVKINGDCSLSDGMRSLAGEGKVGTFDIKDAYWQDVDTPSALKHAEKVLVRSCRKPTDGIVSRNLNRPISGFISYYLVKTPLTANHVTFIVTLIGLLSGYLAAQGSYTSYLYGAILFKLTSILDGVDGEMAKLRFTASKFGQWFDTIGDNLTYVVFIAGTVIGLQRSGYEYINILGPAAIVGIGMLLFMMFLYIIKFSNSGSLLAVQSDLVGNKNLSLFSRIFTKFYFLIKRDFFALLFLVLAIAGKPQWILFLIALATNVAWLVILSSVLKKRKSHEA